MSLFDSAFTSTSMQEKHRRVEESFARLAARQQATSFDPYSTGGQEPMPGTGYALPEPAYTYQRPTPPSISPPSFEGSAGLAVDRPMPSLNPQYAPPEPAYYTPPPRYDNSYLSTGFDEPQFGSGINPQLLDRARMQLASFAPEPYDYATAYGPLLADPYEVDRQNFTASRFAEEERSRQEAERAISGGFLEPVSRAVTGGFEDIYGTEVPYVSDFMRERVRPVAGDFGQALGRSIPGASTALDLTSGIFGTPDSGQVGRFLGEAVVPTTLGDFVAESIPGIGFVPDAVRAGRRLAPEVQDVIRRGSSAVEGRIGQPLSGEAGFARLGGRDPELARQVSEINASGGRLQVRLAPERMAQQPGDVLITGTDSLGRQTRIVGRNAPLRPDDEAFLKGTPPTPGARQAAADLSPPAAAPPVAPVSAQGARPGPQRPAAVGTVGDAGGAPPAKPPEPPASGGPPSGPLSEGDAVMALRNALREGTGQQRIDIVHQGRARQAARIRAALQGGGSAAEAGSAGAGKILPEDGIGFKLPVEADEALIQKALQLERDGAIGLFDAVYGVRRALDEGRRLGPTPRQAELLSKLTQIDEAAFEPFVRTRMAVDQDWRTAINEAVAKVGVDESPLIRNQLQAAERARLEAARLDARGASEAAARARLRAQQHLEKAEALRSEAAQRGEANMQRRLDAIDARYERQLEALMNRQAREAEQGVTRAERARQLRLDREEMAAFRQQQREFVRRAVEEEKRMNRARKVFGNAVDEVAYAFETIDYGQGMLTPAQWSALEHFTDMTKGVIESPSVMQKVYSAARPLTRYGSGDVADSKLAELIAREAELRTVLQRSDVPMTHDNLNAIVRNWREEQVTRYFEGEELDKARSLLRESAQRARNRDVLDEVADTLKGTMLNADLAIFGQQLEAAVRRGVMPTTVGVMRDTVNRIASRLNLPGMPEVYLRSDLDHVSQAVADGLQMAGAQTADIQVKGRSLFGRFPGAGKQVEAALDKLAEVQYGNILGTVRLRAYEGLLLQNKVFHILTMGKLGGNIRDPLVRRHIAEMANMVGSTSRGASMVGRAKTESRMLLSPRMTRAQVNEVLTPLRTFRSQEDVLNTMNLIGSVALYFGAAKVLNDQFGITPFEMDPFEFGFGQITLNEKDAQGRNQIIDLFPQAAFPKALFRSVMAMEDGDMTRLADAWQRYGAGRLNVIPSGALRFAGYGYDTEGQFSGIGLGDERIGSKEALIANIPIPLTAREGIKDPSPAGIASAIFGQSTFPESVYGSEDRAAQEIYGQDFADLNVLDQAAVHVQMASEGVPIEDWRRIGPYWGATDKAYEIVQSENAWMAEFATLEDFRAEAMRRFGAAGANQQSAERAVQKMERELGLAKTIKAVRKAVVARDPEIVDAMQRQYEAGELDFPPSNEFIEFAEEIREGAGAR